MQPITGSTNINERVATAIRVELARRNLRGSALAAILDVAPSSVSRKLSGLTPFTVEDLVLISEAWVVPIAQLVGEPVTASSAA